MATNSATGARAAKATSPPRIEIPFHKPCVGDEEVRAVAEVIRSGWLTSGARVAEFEKKFAAYVGAEDAVAVSSGTAALHLALEAAGVGAADEVIVPTTTFTATAAAVMYAGARPVLADVDAATMNLSVADARRRITACTRAIVPVHLAGQPCDMAEVQGLAEEHGLRVIEDAAHALPAAYHGARVGSGNEFACFSFYASKPVTTGEGGMVTTRNAAAARWMRLMRLHGIERSNAGANLTGNEGTGDGSEDTSRGALGQVCGSVDYEVNEAGYKYNLSDLNAAIGIVQLGKCDAMAQARKRIAARYSELLGTESVFEVPAVRGDRESAWHLYILRLRTERLRIDRGQLIEKLSEQGIACSVHFKPLHLHALYQREFGYQAGDFPTAEAEYRRCVSLPIYPDLSLEQVDYICECLLAVAWENRIEG